VAGQPTTKCELMARIDFTDCEAALIFITAAVRYGINMRQVTGGRQRGRPLCPWPEPAISRHGASSVEAKPYDFWSSIMPRHARKRGWLLQR
jgi:hypothetical protein